MKKITSLIGLFIILFSFLVVAQEEHDFTEAKQLIDSGVGCNQLTNEQLEEIGDYYMEQMHPGEAHEYMDRMMGGEGSESLKQVHINIARRVYCNENIDMRGMMGRGMMGNYYYQNSQNGNSYQNNFIEFKIFFYILIILVIIILILVTFLLINKLKKQRGGNNKHG